MTLRRQLIAPALGLLALAGCGGGSPLPDHAKVEMADFAYGPSSVTIAAGGSVSWTDSDQAPHTATADDQMTFDTGTLDSGATMTETFSKPGTYTYFCRFHPFMHGTVIVR
jgi:plastocyanin